VNLPYAIDRKYPNANREWIWQFVFPSSQIVKDPRSDLMCRHHLHESGVQKAVKQAVRATQISKQDAILFATVLPHTCWKQATTFARFKSF
jgi:hypothetical protein